MRTLKISMLFLCACVVLVNGCGPGLQDLKVRNAAQAKLIKELESDLQITKLQLGQLKRQVGDAGGVCDIKMDALRQMIKALEEDLGRKQNLIARMQQQLLGEAALPPELSTALEDFAAGEEMVTFDASRGIVKFKSDLLFKSGSDVVLPAAGKAVKSLCRILNSNVAKKFDIIIAGHTDDQPIRYSRPKHPTNWHLSVHRAIAVQKIMVKNKLAEARTSVRGFGEFRPIEPNKPNKKGNPKNRRVEIYIVPKGM